MNCGNAFQGNYCPSCGQPASTHRFHAKEIFSTLAEVVLHGESKFFTTCKALLFSPGNMTREYLLGCRRKYYKPLPLLFFLIAIYTFITLLKTDLISPFDAIVDIDTATKEQNLPYSSSATLNITLTIFFALMHNKVYSALFSVIFNVVPYQFFFRKCLIKRPDGSNEPLNLAEHFFTLVYLACINMLIAYFALPFIVLFPESVPIFKTLFFIMPTIVSIFMYHQLCSISGLRSTVLNIAATMVSIISAIAILLLTFGVIYGIENTMK